MIFEEEGVLPYLNQEEISGEEDEEKENEVDEFEEEAAEDEDFEEEF